MTRDLLVPTMAKVVRRRQETSDTFSIQLEPEEPMAAFRPGQFNMLYAFGSGEVAISISGDPSKTGELWHTIRVVGPVTRALGRLRRGDTLGVRGPFGTPWPVELAQGRDAVFVAGGIGFAPLMPALHAVLSDKKRTGRTVLVYGARKPADLLFRRQRERWKRRLGKNLIVTVDTADDTWPGKTGVVTKWLGRVTFDPTRAVAFTCGPEIMMRFVTRELVRLGVSESDVFVSLERNMKCALGTCGHCMLGGHFVCKDGPVFSQTRIGPLLRTAEL